MAGRGEACQRSLDLETALFVRVEVPALDLRAQVSVALNPSCKEQIIDGLDEVVSGVVAFYHDYAVSVDKDVTDSSVQRLQERALEDLAGWQAKLKSADEWKARADRSASQLTKMRDAYYKELFFLREQIYQQKKAQQEGAGLQLSYVSHFDPTNYIEDAEVAELVNQKVSLVQQELGSKLHEMESKCADTVAAIKEQLKVKNFILSQQEKLLAKLNTLADRDTHHDVGDAPAPAEKDRIAREVLRRSLEHKFCTVKAVKEAIGVHRKMDKHVGAAEFTEVIAALLETTPTGVDTMQLFVELSAGKLAVPIGALVDALMMPARGPRPGRRRSCGTVSNNQLAPPPTRRRSVGCDRPFQQQQERAAQVRVPSPSAGRSDQECSSDDSDSSGLSASSSDRGPSTSGSTRGKVPPAEGAAAGPDAKRRLDEHVDAAEFAQLVCSLKSACRQRAANPKRFFEEHSGGSATARFDALLEAMLLTPPAQGSQPRHPTQGSFTGSSQSVCTSSRSSYASRNALHVERRPSRDTDVSSLSDAGSAADLTDQILSGTFSGRAGYELSSRPVKTLSKVKYEVGAAGGNHAIDGAAVPSLEPVSSKRRWSLGIQLDRVRRRHWSIGGGDKLTDFFSSPAPVGSADVANSQPLRSNNLLRLSWFKLRRRSSNGSNTSRAQSNVSVSTNSTEVQASSETTDQEVQVSMPPDGPAPVEDSPMKARLVEIIDVVLGAGPADIETMVTSLCARLLDVFHADVSLADVTVLDSALGGSAGSSSSSLQQWQPRPAGSAATWAASRDWANASRGRVSLNVPAVESPRPGTGDHDALPTRSPDLFHHLSRNGWRRVSQAAGAEEERLTLTPRGADGAETSMSGPLPATRLEPLQHGPLRKCKTPSTLDTQRNTKRAETTPALEPLGAGIQPIGAAAPVIHSRTYQSNGGAPPGAAVRSIVPKLSLPAGGFMKGGGQHKRMSVDAAAAAASSADPRGDGKAAGQNKRSSIDAAAAEPQGDGGVSLPLSGRRCSAPQHVAEMQLGHPPETSGRRSSAPQNVNPSAVHPAEAAPSSPVPRSSRGKSWQQPHTLPSLTRNAMKGDG